MDDLKITEIEAKKNLEARLARIEGQIHGVRDMVQREEPFKDIVQQLAAVRSALNKVFAEIVADAMETVLTEKNRVDPSQHEQLIGLTKIIVLYG